MRTTLTLDADVAECIRKETRSRRRSLKAVVNERLRIGFGLVVEENKAPYRIQPHHSPFQPGVDSGKLNQLADELESSNSLKDFSKPASE